MPKTDFDYPRFEDLNQSDETDCPKLVYESGTVDTHLFEDQNLFGDTANAQFNDDIPTYVKAQVQVRHTVRFYPDRDRSTGRYIYAVDDPAHWSNYRAYRYGEDLRRRLTHSLTQTYVDQYGNLEWYTPRYMAFDRITYQDTLLDQPQAQVDRIAKAEYGLFYPISDQYLAQYKAELLAQRFPYQFDWPRELDAFGEEAANYPYIGTELAIDPDLLQRLPAFDNYDYYNDQEYTHMRYIWNWLERATYSDPIATERPSTQEEMDTTTFPSLADTVRAQLTVAESKIQNIRRTITLHPEPEKRFHTLDYERPFDMWTSHRDEDPSIEQLCYEPGDADYLVFQPEWANTPIAVFSDPDCVPVDGFPDGARPMRWNLTVIRLDRSAEHSTVFADTKDEALAQIVGEYYTASATPISVIGEHYHDTFDRIDQLLRFYSNRIEFARLVGTPDLAKQYDPVLNGLSEIDDVEPRVIDTHTFEVDRWESILVGVSPYEQPRVDGEASYPWGGVLDSDPLEDRQFEFDTFGHLNLEIPVEPAETEPVTTTVESFHIVLPFSVRHEFLDSEVEMDSGRLMDSSAYSFHSWNDLHHPYMPGDHFPPEKCSLKQWFAKSQPEQILETHPNVIFNGNVPITADTLRRPIIEVERCDDDTIPCNPDTIFNTDYRPQYDTAPSFAAFNPFDDYHFGVRDYFDHAGTDYVDETYGNGMARIYKDAHPLDLNQAAIPEPTFDPETLSWNMDILLDPLENERRLDGEKVTFAEPQVLQPHQEQSTFLIAPVWVEIHRDAGPPIIEVTVDAPVIAVEADGPIIAVDTDPAILQVDDADAPIIEVERIIE